MNFFLSIRAYFFKKFIKSLKLMKCSEFWQVLLKHRQTKQCRELGWEGATEIARSFPNTRWMLHCQRKNGWENHLLSRVGLVEYIRIRRRALYLVDISMMWVCLMSPREYPTSNIIYSFTLYRKIPYISQKDSWEYFNELEMYTL